MVLYEIIIPLALLVAPWLVTRFIFATAQSQKVRYIQSLPYAAAAGSLWAIGFWLPNVPVTPITDSFSLHMAGGAAAAVLWMYAVHAYGPHFTLWWQAPLTLYVLVSGLGVLNELFEVFLNASGLLYVYNRDADWDLVANTTGATIIFALWLMTRWLRKV